tara:strand:- start:75 stop:878 length:804 start_codon:yes stop_codon:yes gene_type:complete
MVTVIIPVYKENLGKKELLSFRQCIKILKNHDIHVICPLGLDLPSEILKEKNVLVKRFNSNFFKNIDGYNKLLLSKEFYLSFKNYRFMLIYQLDAYVFKDELEYWCNKDYDYIGAPWAYKNDSGKIELRTGNGGFSLRKISSHLKIFDKYKIIDSRKGIINDFWNQGKLAFIMKMYSWIPRLVGLKNNSKYFIKNFEKNEDYFWALYAPQINKKFKVAPPSEALKFGFELNPRYLYELNNKTLPFGCHAWEKYDSKFWHNHINIKDN